MSEHLPLQRIRTVLLAVLALVGVGFLLHYAKAVILPFLVAFFLMILLSPLVRWLKDHRVPASVAVPAAMAIVGILILALGAAFFLNLDPIIRAWPRYQERGTTLLDRAFRGLERVGVKQEQIKELLLPEEKGAPPGTARSDEERIWQKAGAYTGTFVSFLTGGVTSFMAFVGQGILVLLYLLFMLFEATRFHEKAEKAFGADSPVFETLGAIQRDVQLYVFWKTGISLVTGALTALACLVFGVDFPLFWGVLAFGLNFIPNLGSVASSILPALLALFQYDGPWRALGLLLTLVVMQNAMGSLLEPRLMGRSLSLSPLVLLLSLVFWGWLWGVVGMILAVPIAVTLKIICRHIPGLQPLSILSEA